MTISDFAIKRPVVTVVAMLALVVFGLFALLRLDVDEFPDLTNPIVFVAVPYPGASPAQVEREVVERMEEAFGGLSGIDEIRSTSLDGFASIIVQFDSSARRRTRRRRTCATPSPASAATCRRRWRSRSSGMFDPERPADRLAGAVVGPA